MAVWDKALYAFLAEKERRSGSLRTVQCCSRMLQHFFGSVGKTPDHVTSPDVLSYADGNGLSGRRPSSVTVGARVARISSFYRFLIRMGALTANPRDALERPKISPSLARGLSGDEVRRLAVLPCSCSGLLHRASASDVTHWSVVAVLNRRPAYPPEPFDLP